MPNGKRDRTKEMLSKMGKFRAHELAPESDLPNPEGLEGIYKKPIVESTKNPMRHEVNKPDRTSDMLKQRNVNDKNVPLSNLTDAMEMNEIYRKQPPVEDTINPLPLRQKPRVSQEPTIDNLLDLFSKTLNESLRSGTMRNTQHKGSYENLYKKMFFQVVDNVQSKTEAEITRDDWIPITIANKVLKNAIAAAAKNQPMDELLMDAKTKLLANLGLDPDLEKGSNPEELQQAALEKTEIKSDEEFVNPPKFDDLYSEEKIVETENPMPKSSHTSPSIKDLKLDSLDENDISDGGYTDEESINPLEYDDVHSEEQVVQSANPMQRGNYNQPVVTGLNLDSLDKSALQDLYLKCKFACTRCLTSLRTEQNRLTIDDDIAQTRIKLLGEALKQLNDQPTKSTLSNFVKCFSDDLAIKAFSNTGSPTVKKLFDIIQVKIKDDLEPKHSIQGIRPR